MQMPVGHLRPPSSFLTGENHAIPPESGSHDRLSFAFALTWFGHSVLRSAGEIDG
jgi:hypothetical protein